MDAHIVTRCLSCANSSFGLSSGILYCRASEATEFAHQMRQQAAPCGPGSVLFTPKETGNQSTKETA